MFKEEHRAEVWQEIRKKDIRVFEELLTPAMLAEAAVRTGVPIIKSPLCLATLTWLGISAAFHRMKPFAEILKGTLKLLEDQAGFANSALGRAQRNGQRRQQKNKKKKSRHKNDPRRDDPTQVTEEAFVQARQRMPLEFWINLIVLLCEQFQAQHAALLRFRGFRVLAIDGTRLTLPDWAASRKHFGTAKNASGSHAAQARLVLLQFPFVRLPYRYELTPLSDGETTVAGRLVKSLQRDDLLLMDAGFWSYGLFWEIQQRQAFFATRLTSKAGLRRVRALGRHEYLVQWTPKDSRGQWRKRGLPKSIELRVIEYQIPGFRPQAIVTNLLDPQRLPREDWVRLTTDCQVRGKFRPGLFHRRWEIETTFRELKVEQGLEGSLRSRTPDSIQWEVAGHMVLYLLVRWLIVEAACKHGLEPLQLSFSAALRELADIRQSLLTAEGRWFQILYQRLLDRVAAHQVPRRPGRHYKRRKKARANKTSRKTTGKKATTRSKPKRPSTARKQRGTRAQKA